MKFACGLTLYNPTQLEINNIFLYSKKFEKVYIFNNSDKLDCEFTFLLEQIDNVYIIHSGSNEGLSVALNCLCLAAIGEFDFICLLDQDSVFSEKNIIKIMSGIEKYNEQDVVIFSPKIVYDHYPQTNVSIEEVSSEDWVITSGSFVNLGLFEAVGGFDEAYFIDRLDFDFCYSSKCKGFKIKIINSSNLFQSLGTTKEIFNFKFFEHSSLRNYYSFRNRIYFYLKKKNGRVLFNSTILVLLSFKQIFRILFFEGDKTEKIKSILLAIKHYASGKMGKKH